MNLKEIKEMIKLMNDNELMEIEVEKEGLKVRLKKSAKEQVERYMETSPHRAAEHTTQPSREAGQKGAAPGGSAGRTEIKSPMVGTFYSAPAPDASPFVDIGAEVEPGQVVCIIEAMKLMNELKSEIKGKITDILVENGEPVEFGQPLFVVEPA
jgi:acetyl-CoA carboxylase biotin carboxyl carrier protein